MYYSSFGDGVGIIVIAGKMLNPVAYLCTVTCFTNSLLFAMEAF